MNSPIYPENALVLAPLSGFTDLPYRRSARRHGAFFAFAEMVDAASLAHTPERGLALAERGEEEDFLGVQVVGADHEWLKRSCDELNTRSFSLLDFNLGCPVAKVVKKGAGAALGRRVDEALRCFEILTQYSRFPVTAKFRILTHDDPAPTVELARGLAELGARALTVHGRALEDFYTGPVRADIISAVREAVSPYGISYFRMFLQVVLRVILALADLLSVISEPGTTLLHDVLINGKIDDASLSGDTLTVHDIEFRFTERRSNLILNDLYTSVVTDDLTAVSQ